MLSVILLSMLMTSDLWEQLQLAVALESGLQDTVDWWRKYFDQFRNTSAIDVKVDGSVLMEKSSLKMVGLSFSSKLAWDSYIISIRKLPPRKLGPWFILWRFFLLKLLYEATIEPCMEHCCDVWAGAPSCYSELLQKRICRTAGSLLVASFEPLHIRQNIASSSLFYRYYSGRCSSEMALNWFHFLFL